MLRLLRQLYLWSTNRFVGKKHTVRRRAAHLLMLHLWNLPILSIDLSDPSRDDFYTTDIPQSDDFLVDAMRGTIIGQAAELTFAEVADELSRGRRFANQRLPDRSLIGFCDGNGNVLGSDAEIIAHAKRECEHVLLGNEITDDFMEVLSKRLVSHYYKTIIHLGDALMKQPLLSSQQACSRLIDGCIRHAPANSLQVYCACHTDPMKLQIDTAIRGFRRQADL
jgi:hypothetical protein